MRCYSYFLDTEMTSKADLTRACRRIYTDVSLPIILRKLYWLKEETIHIFIHTFWMIRSCALLSISKTWFYTFLWYCFQINSNQCSEKALTYICLLDPSILINLTSPFPILEVSGVRFHFYSFSNRYSCSASDLGLHFLPMSQTWDARLIWVKWSMGLTLNFVQKKHGKKCRTCISQVTDPFCVDIQASFFIMIKVPFTVFRKFDYLDGFRFIGNSKMSLHKTRSEQIE